MTHEKPLSATERITAKKKAVFLFLNLQIIVSICISLGIFLGIGSHSGYSFFLGTLSSILPSFYMAWRVFGYKGIRPAKDVVRSFYRGESGKLVLTMVILSLVFLLVKPLSAEMFFSGFGLAILSHWLSLVVLKD